MARNKNKHLKKEERAKIERYLSYDWSIAQIARELGRDKNTIAREIRRNYKTTPSRAANDCVHKDDCTRKHLCGDKTCKSFCSRKCIRTCSGMCNDYAPSVCDRHTKAPYVCNGCGRLEKSCNREHRIYNADYAQSTYRTTLKGKRSGTKLTPTELEKINATVSPRIVDGGQSPQDILDSVESKEVCGISRSTMYRLIHAGLLDAKPVDLPESVGRRKRRPKPKLHNGVISSLGNKAGHLYGDFLEYMEQHPDAEYWQMDSLEGLSTDKKAILTIHHPDHKMQLGFLLPTHTEKSVVEVFDELEGQLGTELFYAMFEVILTDNGHEFWDIDGMETSCLDPTVKRTHIFFCDKNRPDQKGACENNHKLVRRILPKGKTSLDKLIQSDVTLTMNHVNSYRRESIDGSCPYDKAMGAYPDEFFEVLNLERIPDEDVILKPGIIRKRIRDRVVKPEPKAVKGSK